MGVYRIIDEADYEEHLDKAGSKLVVVEFFSNSCGHCRTIAPVVEKLSSELKTEVVFLKVEVEKNADIARAEQVAFTPTFVMYKKKVKLDVPPSSNEFQLKETISKFK